MNQIDLLITVIFKLLLWLPPFPLSLPAFSCLGSRNTAQSGLNSQSHLHLSLNG